MSSVQFGGLISGLKTADIIDALVAVQKQPLVRLQQQEARLTAQKVAYGQLGNAISDLQAKIKAFTTSSAGSARSAFSSDTTAFSASAGPTASVGQYQITVDRLATATKATSLGALGTPLTLGVDTSKTLDSLNLATPISAGKMTINVDGTAVQVTVGATNSTTLQSVIDALANSVQNQLALTDAGATVNVSVVGSQLQMSITGGTGAPHTISFGDPGDTSNAAAALGLTSAGVTGVSNPTMTGAAYLDPVLSSLNTAGSITSGQISAIVDGVIVHYTVGDPTKTTMTQLLKEFAGAIQTQLRAGGPNKAADATATVTGSVAGNAVQLAVSAAGTTHSISFGAAGDASNALGILGLATQSATNATNPTITGSSSAGVVRTTSTLDAAGLTGLTSTKTGKLTINGVDVAYDTTVDSLTTIVTRINNSTAGVLASVDRTNDRIVLTRKDTGSLAIDIRDTSGTLAAALKLAPTTTNAQTLGASAQITVDGRTITSASNAVTNAIEGVTINLLSRTDLGATETLTVGVDKSAISNSLNDFIRSFNSLGDLLDKLTQNTPGQAGGTAGQSGPLASDPTALTLFTSLRQTLMSSSVVGGSLMSLQSIGISSGKVGAAVGTTDRLQLDTDKLNATLDTDPTRVATLLNDAANGVLKPVLDRLSTYVSDTDPDAYVAAHTDGIDTEIRSLRQNETDIQARVDAYQATLEAKYAALERTLATLQAQSAQVSAQATSMSK